MTKWGFSHPLLSPLPLSSVENFHYEYDDMKGLLKSALYVYSTLLNAAFPQQCKFKIKPSMAFQQINSNENIYVSIHSDKAAQESIQITQLEALVSALNGHPFTLIDNLYIDEEFTMKDLPSSIDGDALYVAHEALLAQSYQPCCLNRFELRYISPKIGFGVFCRERIKKNDVVFFYGGKKRIHDDDHEKYAFQCQLDSLKMYIDAREFGNIARFVNHAPNPTANPHPSLLEANIHSSSHYLQSMEVIVFAANRDILEGEQLLVDYGKKFFRKASIHRFHHQHNVVHYCKKIIALNSSQALAQLRMMASHGVLRAGRFLLLRTFVIVGLISLVMGILAK